MGCSADAQWTAASVQGWQLTAHTSGVPAFLLGWSRGSQEMLEHLYSFSNTSGSFPLFQMFPEDIGWEETCIIADGQSSLCSRKLSMEGLVYSKFFSEVDGRMW